MGPLDIVNLIDPLLLLYYNSGNIIVDSAALLGYTFILTDLRNKTLGIIHNINLDLAAIAIGRGLNFENREGRGPGFSFLKGRAFR